MAEDKNSFILYTDQRGIFEKLSNEQAGKLIKHILLTNYSKLGTINTLNPLILSLSFICFIALMKTIYFALNNLVSDQVILWNWQRYNS